jgi:prepilin-type N-terminal cleavage/methylation domain-containing protein
MIRLGASRLHRHRVRAGFTLIELLSVIAIFALLAGIALPNLGIRTGRALDAESKKLAATLEFARQRAVMTSTPHRLVIDIDLAAYWLEEWVDAGDPGLEDAPPAPPPLDSPGASVAMAPPEAAAFEFRPMLGTLGALTQLDAAISIAAVETPETVFEAGEVHVVFEGDGTSEPTWIELATDDGEAIALQLAPLADTVRFEHGDG